MKRSINLCLIVATIGSYGNLSAAIIDGTNAASGYDKRRIYPGHDKHYSAPNQDQQGQQNRNLNFFGIDFGFDFDFDFGLDSSFLYRNPQSSVGESLRRGIYDPIAHSVGLLQTDSDRGTGFLNVGTGFLIAPDLVLTAGHVARNMSGKRGKFSIYKPKTNNRVSRKVIRLTIGTSYKDSKSHCDDIALLKLESPLVGYPSLKISQEDPKDFINRNIAIVSDNVFKMTTKVSAEADFVVDAEGEIKKPSREVGYINVFSTPVRHLIITKFSFSENGVFILRNKSSLPKASAEDRAEREEFDAKMADRAVKYAKMGLDQSDIDKARFFNANRENFYSKAFVADPAGHRLQGGNIRGDSGSPVISKVNGEYQAVGMVVAGSGDFPEYFYLQIYNHIDWIKRAIKKLR